MKEILSVNNLSIKLKESSKEIVKGISFSICEGETLVLLGQSGSGKSMTCHSIMGLLDENHFLAAGNIGYHGKNILLLNKKEKLQLFGSEIAFIPQNPMTALDPSMRIGNQMDETLKLHSKMNKTDRKARIENALKEAGLTDIKKIITSYPYTLSGGMLQRVIIAMALMVNAKLIIADEPTTALDVVHRNETISQFVKLREAGVAVLMVTHDFAAASQLGGNLSIMKDGELIEQGLLCDVIKNPVHEYTKALLNASSLTSYNKKKESYYA